MKVVEVGGYPVGVGTVLALLVLIAGFVFLLMGNYDPKAMLIMIIALALARLL